MPTEPSTGLTPAEKRKITIAARVELERQQQAAFEAKTKKPGGGRAAKAKAQHKAVWKVDQPATRKRTSSTTQASETVKKARAAKDASASEGEDAEPPIPAKGAAVVKARTSLVASSEFAPATIDDSDESAAEGKSKLKRIDFANLPAASKARIATQAKAIASKVFSGGKPKAKKPPARVVAESASESEAVESEDKSDDGESEDCAADVAPDETEFRAEVPRVVGKKPKPVEVNSDDDVIEDVNGRAAEDLFSDHSIEIDKPRPRHRQSPVELDSDDSFPDAPPRIGNDGSDIDMPAADTSRRTHSRRSSASSWSSGRDLRVPDSEGEEVIDNISRPDKKRQPAYAGNDDMQLHEAIAKGLSTVSRFGSTHSRRSSTHSRHPSEAADSDADDSDDDAGLKKKRKAEMERPEVLPAPTGMDTQLHRIAAAAADAKSRPESDWHISARLLFPAPGKDIGITGQTDEVKAMLHGCIDIIKLSLFFEDAYPTILSRAGFARTYLLMAAQSHAARHIKHRLLKDESFAARLAAIPLDRINIVRGDIAKAAAQDVAGLFGFALASPEEVKTIVNARLQDYKYIFPVDPVTKRLKTELPFLNDAIVSALKKSVFTGQFGTKNLNRFTSTNERHPERLEAPDAMVCIGATAVHAALTAYRATGKYQKIPFTASAYEDVYRNHMRTLSDTRAYSPKALNVVLHRLYDALNESTTATPNASASSSLLINLVEVPDSD
ncbi:hypothetical protein C8R46DRAFT_1213705 [Mycena filopes]|nr:hypothetical protein C8R46DRAFT_1213705 [Mycena filopes]